MRLQVIRIFAIFALMSSTTHIPTAAANDQPPTADWSHSEGSATTFMAGTYVVFDGSLSHDNDENGNSINYYVWYVDGMVKFQGSSASSFGWTFALETGDTQQSVQIKLRVRDDEGSWDSYTRSYTIRQEPGRAYYVKDHVPAPRSFSVGEGNVRVTVDEDGTAIGWDDYYPFGKVMPGRSSNNANPNDLYKYNGKELDSEENLNLAYYGARMYDPEIGRFMSIDRFADKYPAMTPYQYAANNPVMFIDVNGDSLVKVQIEDPNGFVTTSDGTGEVLIDHRFKGFLKDIVSTAIANEINLQVNSSFRTLDKQLSDEIQENGTTPAGPKSPHVAGLAIDFNLFVDNNRSKGFLEDNQGQTASNNPFIQGISDAGGRFGGDFNKTDPVHADLAHSSQIKNRFGVPFAQIRNENQNQVHNNEPIKTIRLIYPSTSGIALNPQN